ncbi:MAG: hypothetical protein WA954_10415 [Parerythrobacter sp.]
MLAIALPLMFLQVGPNPSPDAIANTVPTLPGVDKKAAVRRTVAAAIGPQCPLDTGADAARIAEDAQLRTTVTTGTDRTAAIHCLAMAQAELGLWQQAAESFARARALVGGNQREQARIGGQRGIALAAAGDTQAAMLAFRQASDDAMAAGEPLLAAAFITEHASLLVNAGEQTQAAQLLADARRDVSAQPQIWLLSATLARRQGDLAQAETFIGQALTLADDAETLLEAGIIAALDGRDEMARERFDDAVMRARTGPVANQARAYLDQLQAPDKTVSGRPD